MSKEYIQWHPAIQGSMSVDRFDPSHLFVVEYESPLSKAPLKMDALFRRVASGSTDNEITEVFRDFNVIEYKSPNDRLNIDTLYKTLAYTFLYKASGSKVNERSIEDMSATLMWKRKPQKMFKQICGLGSMVVERHPGIYDLTVPIPFPIQVVVTRELDPELHPALRVVTNELLEGDANRFLELRHSLTEKGDLEDFTAIMQAVMAANKNLMDRVLEGDDDMKDYLMEFVKDRVDEQVDKARADERAAATTETILMITRCLMKSLGFSATKALESMGVAARDIDKYAAML